jgi:hypothetical protein
MFKIIDNFFTDNECESALEFVKNQEQMWYQCPWTSMYILGNSLFRKISFSENKIDYGNYFESNYIDNQSIDLFKSKLENLYGRVEFISRFSRPGFQIIKLNENKNPSVWHYDNMITCFPFDGVFSDYSNNFDEYFDRKLIFTVLLSDGDYSFDYYPETISKFGKNYFETSQISPLCNDHRNLVGDVCPNPSCVLKEYKTVYYKKGTMLVQEERFLHRVGLKDLNDSENLRITLQGYGLIKNNILYLIW